MRCVFGFFALLECLLLVAVTENVRRLREIVNLEPKTAWIPPGVKEIRWESAMRFLGLPLVSVAMNSNTLQSPFKRKARGWIAVGDIALGGLFAMGTIAVAPISLGGFALGLISIGAVVVGGVGIGGMALGGLVVAGIALGWFLALGGIAISLDLAVGTVAVALNAAVGILVHAPIIGAEAWDSFSQNSMAQMVMSLLPYFGWISLLSVPSILLALRQLKTVPDKRDKLKRKT